MHTNSVEEQILKKVVQNTDFLKKLEVYIKNHISIKSLLMKTIEDVPEEYILSISIVDSFGKMIESTGSVFGRYEAEVTFGEKNQFKLQCSVSKKEEKKVNILILGFSKSGKSSIIHRINFNSFFGTKLHNIGISTSQCFFLGKDLHFTEISGNHELLSFFLQTKVKDNFDAILYVFDQNFIYREEKYNLILSHLKKIEDSFEPKILFVSTKSDIRDSDITFNRLKNKLKSLSLNEEYLMQYSSLTNENFNSLINFFKLL